MMKFISALTVVFMLVMAPVNEGLAIDPGARAQQTKNLKAPHPKQFTKTYRPMMEANPGCSCECTCPSPGIWECEPKGSQCDKDEGGKTCECD